MTLLIHHAECILFLFGFCHIAQDFPMQSIVYYDFHAYPVLEDCPLDKNAWAHASDILNCSNPMDSLKNRYHCMPNRHKTKLLEFCYPRDRVRMSPGFCFVLADNGLITRFEDTSCANFSNNSCQMSYNEANEMYKHPACLRINPDKGCYTSDPACSTVNAMNSAKVSETTPPGFVETRETTNFREENQRFPAKEESEDSSTHSCICITLVAIVISSTL